MCFLLLNLARFVLACSDGCFMPSRYYRIITTVHRDASFQIFKSRFSWKQALQIKAAHHNFSKVRSSTAVHARYISTVRKKRLLIENLTMISNLLNRLRKEKVMEKKKPITNPKKLQDCRFTTSNWINFVFDLILQLGSLKKWVGWILKRFSGQARFNI